MSKIESGTVELVEEEFYLSDLIDNLLTMTNAQMKEHRHELSVNISGVTHEAVVGDSLRIQKVFTNLLGNAVKYTPDGLEAVDKITECPDGYFDMVLMDIQMPKMNGYDATRVIRAMDRHYCKQVPIVAMTANAFAEDIHAAKTAGMNEHIAKPLDLNTLVRILKKWI